jgi:hypothetical protein
MIIKFNFVVIFIALNYNVINCINIVGQFYQTLVETVLTTSMVKVLNATFNNIVGVVLLLVCKIVNDQENT